jgi:hypothetical protein
LSDLITQTSVCYPKLAHISDCGRKRPCCMSFFDQLVWFQRKASPPLPSQLFLAFFSSFFPVFPFRFVSFEFRSIPGTFSNTYLTPLRPALCSEHSQHYQNGDSSRLALQEYIAAIPTQWRGSRTTGSMSQFSTPCGIECGPCIAVFSSVLAYAALTAFPILRSPTCH